MGKMTLRNFRTVHGEQMPADIARQTNLGRHSLKHIKSFLSGVFKQAKRLGVLDGVNPMMDVSIPRSREPEETYAYSLPQIKAMLAVLPEPAWTVVLTAALTGLRKGEIRGLAWEDFVGTELTVNRSVWNSTVNEPKTRRSQAAIPVVSQLADALNAHRAGAGKLAVGFIFQGGTGKPLNLDNLARRVIQPAIEKCGVCDQSKEEHKTEGHLFEHDKALPKWYGWHVFRRGLATNLHQLGVADKTIQAILRYSNVGLTMNVYVKSVSESQVRQWIL
jgi:integrase